MAVENQTIAPYYANTRNPYSYEKVEQINRDISTGWLTLDEITQQLNLFQDESQDGYLESLELATRMAIEDFVGFAIFPTLKNIRAASLLAHGMQALRLNKGLQRLVLRAHFGCGLNPLRLFFDWHRGIAHFETKKFAFGFVVPRLISISPRCLSITSTAIAGVISRPALSESVVVLASRIPQAIIVS